MARHFETIQNAFLENMTGKDYKQIKEKWGILKKDAKEAGIFHIPPSSDRDLCIKALLQAELSPEEIVATGMTTDKLDKDGAEKDLFTGRMVFPVKDEDDEEILRLCGRDWDGVDGRRAEPAKWMNSKGEIKCLANESALKKAKAKPEGKRRVGVAEGMPNALAAKSHGMNVCGPLGKENFKAEFAKKFDGLDGVFIFPDNDADGGGLKAARNWGLNLAPILGPQNIQMVKLPDEDGTVNDLADYLLKHAVQDVTALCDEAPNLLDFELKLAAENPDPNVTFEERFDRLVSLLSYLEDGSVTEYCRQKVQTTFPEYRVKHEIEDLKKLVKNVRKAREKSETARELKLAKPDTEEAGIKIEYEAIDIEGLVDIIPGGSSHFGYYIVDLDTKKTEWVPWLERVEDDGTIVRTKPPQHAPKLKDLSKAFTYGNLEDIETAREKKLYLDKDFINMVVKDYYGELVDLPEGQDWGLFLFLWAAHTYVLDQPEVHHTPFILTKGEEAKGKTRACAGTANISYRGYSDPSPTEASFFRMKDYFGATFFFNGVDIRKEAEAKEFTATLHSAWAKGDYIFRTGDAKQSKFLDLKMYGPFGAVLVSSNWDFQSTFESRGILLPLQDSGRDENSDFQYDLPDMIPLAREIKSIYLAMRADVLCGELKLAEVPRPTSGRLGEAFRPLYMILKTLCPDREQAFLDLVKSVRNTKLRLRATSVEGLILAAVKEVIDSDLLSHGFVPFDIVVDLMNVDVPVEKLAKEGFRAKTVESRLNKLGFEVSREEEDDGTKYKAILIIPQHLGNLLAKYGLDRLPDDDDGPPDAGAVPPRDKPPGGNGPQDTAAVPPHDSAVKNPPDDIPQFQSDPPDNEPVEEDPENEIAQMLFRSFKLGGTSGFHTN